MKRWDLYQELLDQDNEVYRDFEGLYTGTTMELLKHLVDEVMEGYQDLEGRKRKVFRDILANLILEYLDIDETMYKDRQYATVVAVTMGYTLYEVFNTRQWTKTLPRFWLNK